MDIEIKTDFIKLGQLLKFSGLAENGAEAKDIIFENEILLNGEVVFERGKKIRKGDKVQIGETVINVC